VIPSTANASRSNHTVRKIKVPGVVSIMLLMPFVKYFRILQWDFSWSRSCQRGQRSGRLKSGDLWSNFMVPAVLKNIDTMTILLCGDNHLAFHIQRWPFPWPRIARLTRMLLMKGHSRERIWIDICVVSSPVEDEDVTSTRDELKVDSIQQGIVPESTEI
jgi:hypothetical protein